MEGGVRLRDEWWEKGRKAAMERAKSSKGKQHLEEGSRISVLI